MKKRDTALIALAIILLVWFLEITLSLKARSFLSLGPSRFMEIFSLAMVYGAISIIISALVLKIQGLSFKGMNRYPHTSKNSQVIIGIASGTVWAGIALFILPILLDGLFDIPQEKKTDFQYTFSNLSYLPLWILLAIFKAGISEELWRTTAIETFKNVFGKRGGIIAVLIGALVFSLGHYYQGWDSVIISGLGGLVYGFLYYFRRSILEVMIAHATRDIIAIVFGYLLF